MKLNNFEKRAFAFGLALSMVVSGSGADFSIVTAAKKPKLSKSKLTITAGKTATLTVKNAKKKVKWSISKKKIAKITNKSGKKQEKAEIKGLKKGKTVVIAKVGKKKIKCKLTVKKQKPNFKSVSVDAFDTSCLVLKLKKKDTSLKVTDLTVTRREESTGAFNNAINVEKLVKVNAKQYRVYLQDYVENGAYVQITSGVSKAETQYKKTFEASDEEVNILLKKGDTLDQSMEDYFSGGIGSVKMNITKGKLPAGLALDKKLYAIKGIPTETVTSQVTVQGVDELGRKAAVKVNFGVYDETVLAVGNDSEEIEWDQDIQDKAAAQVAANATKLDADKRDDNLSCYVENYKIAPQGGSGNYTFTLDTPDNADVRLSTDKVSDDAAKTVTKQSASFTRLCIPYSISAGTHTYKVIATDVMDANRTCTATITVKIVPMYNVNGIVKSTNGLPVTGSYVRFISASGKTMGDSYTCFTSTEYNYSARGGDAEVGVYDMEVPAGTYIVKVYGDVAYEMTKQIKVTKADKMTTVTIPERFYAVSGKATYSNSSNKLANRTIYFESQKQQYESTQGDFSTTTNSRGSFNIALPANSYVAYIVDEKGNRKYFGSKITVTNKDISVGTIKATLARYSVEGIVFNGTSVDQQTQFADKIKDTTLYFYNDKGICVANPSVDSEGYYKVFLPGGSTYVVKVKFANALRTLGTVAVAQDNQKDVNLTYTVATDITGAVAYAASPLALESVLNSIGGNDVTWSFTPAATGKYDFKVSNAVNKGCQVALFDANMQYITGTSSDASDDEEDHATVYAYLRNVTLDANKTYYVKVQPTGVRGGYPYTPQAQGEVKLVITMQQIVTPAPTMTPDPTDSAKPSETPDATATIKPSQAPDVTDTPAPSESAAPSSSADVND